MNKLRVFLDDVRPAPDANWTVVRDPKLAIVMLEFGIVEEISFDHDLGEGQKTGYEVACVIEWLVHKGKIDMPKWHVHSANPVGRANITAAMQAAEKLAQRNKE